MYIKASKKWQPVLNIAMVIIGCFIMGFAFSMFFEPNHISTGGFSGIAMMLSSLFKKAGVKFLTTSVLYFTMNAILYVIAIRSMGKTFAINAVVGVASFSGSMEIFKLIPKFANFDLIISALFGGVLIGFGLGLVVRFGGSTGGSDMVACMVRKRHPNAHIGRIAVCLDACVVALTLVVYKNGVELLPYTIIAIAINAFMVDFVNEGYKQVRAYTIITNKPDEVAEKIKSTLKRGCSMSHIKGMYDNADRGCLVCLITKYQAGTMKNLILELDPKAFVYSVPVSEVIGTWRRQSHELDADEFDSKPLFKRKKKESEAQQDVIQTFPENQDVNENAVAQTETVIETVKEEKIEIKETAEEVQPKKKTTKRKTEQKK